MRAKFATIFILCGTLLFASFVPGVLGQGEEEGGQVQIRPYDLYFTANGNDVGNDKVASVLNVPCGTPRVYGLTQAKPDTDTTPGKAYLNRAALEAGSILTCETDWVFLAPKAVKFSGNAVVTFPLNCDHPGVIQPLLGSVEVHILRGTEPVDDGSWGGAGMGICNGQPFNVRVEIPIDGTMLGVGQALTVRVEVKAVNTEPILFPYWYIETSPQAKVAGQVETTPQCSDTVDNDGDSKIDFGTAPTNDPGCTSPTDDDETDEDVDPNPECSDTIDNDADGKTDFGTQDSNDPGCTSAEDDDETDGDTEPECSDTKDNDGDVKVDFGSGANNDPGCVSPEDDDESDETEPTGDAPGCARDDPPEAEVTRPVGEAFSLVAVCTDPDDDLESGTWTVDDQPKSEEELGASPDDVDEEFTFDTPGSHVIELTPTDREGQEGGPASWVVHITDDSNDGDAPACTRDEPSSFDITRPMGEPFTLRASCTDPDDDLDGGTWVVDDEPGSDDDLGDSPSTAEEEFEFDECGTHHIHFVPTDKAGNVGSSASWRVTINGCTSPSPTTTSPGPTESESPSPTETTPIPVFPSSLAFLLAAVGGLGGGFVILRRRGA